MTAQPLFDTARFRDRLTASGMPDGQARALTEGLDEALRGATATRADVEKQGDRLSGLLAEQDARLDAQVLRLDAQVLRLDAKIDALGQRLDAKIDEVERRLEAKIDALEQRLDAKIDALAERLDAKIDALGRRLDAKIDAVEKRLDEAFARRLAESQATQIKWLVGSLVGCFGLLFAALKLFP